MRARQAPDRAGRFASGLTLNGNPRMLDHSRRQQLWDRIHQETPVPEQPEADIAAFAQCLQQRLPPGSAVLDAGCGRGRHTLYLSRLGLSLYGCDLSLTALKTAQARAHQAGLPATFQAADLARLPYAHNFFAAAVCVHVLSYNLRADIDKGVRELRRVLRPGGWLYFDLLDCDDAEYGCGQELEEDTFLGPDGVPAHFSSRQEVDDLLDGFTWERLARLEFRSSSTRVRVDWTIWATRSGG